VQRAFDHHGRRGGGIGVAGASARAVAKAAMSAAQMCGFEWLCFMA